MSELENKTKPYIDLTPVDHYIAASKCLQVVADFAEKVADGARVNEQAAETLIDTMMQRAQLHATLACVDPRIATMANEKYYQDNPEEESD